MGRSRFGGCGSSRARGMRWRGYARLNIVRVHDRLGDVNGLACPQHWTVGPWVRGINNQTEAIVASIFHDDRSHLLQNTLRDFVLLRLRIVARVLDRAVKFLLLLFNLLDQTGAGIVVKLVALCGKLLFQTLNFVVLPLELRLFGLKLLAKRFEIALAFITREDSLLHADGSYFCAVAGRNRCSGRGGQWI